MLALEKIGFKIGDCIGKGGFSKVYKAEYRDKKDTKPIKLACKIIKKVKEYPADTRRKSQKEEVDLSEKVEREIESIIRSSNKHPYIIETHSIYEDKDSVFIFMRLAENWDLLKYLQKYKKADEFQVNLWAYQLVSALQYLHGIGWAHRDLKCQNILLTKHNNIRLGDFGLARYCVDGKDDINKITIPDDITLCETFCGSEEYMAPEVISQKRYDPKKSDVWSLGVVFFAMLYGRYPFTLNRNSDLETQLSKVYKSQMNREYSRAQDKSIKLSTPCLEVMHKCLEPKAAKRYSINQIGGMEWFKKKIVKDTTSCEG